MNNKRSIWWTCAATTTLVALGFLLACGPALECGTWAFSGTPVSTPTYSYFPLTSAFTFTPKDCGQNCQCSKDVMIQMVAVFDTDPLSRGYVYPNSAQEARATSNGWAIDRVEGEAYGWYGLLNDGSTFYSFWNTPGSNGTANTLSDQPAWNDTVFFYAVDAAVCFTPACQNKILGYYLWSWTISYTATTSSPTQEYVGSPFIMAPAWQSLATEFQAAISDWNSWAPSSGVEWGSSGVSGEPSVPHAVAFPLLTDL
jgi:hypothetical protein